MRSHAGLPLRWSSMNLVGTLNLFGHAPWFVSQSLRSTVLSADLAEAELLSRRALRPPTSHPAGPASDAIIPNSGRWSSEEDGPILKDGAVVAQGFVR